MSTRHKTSHSQVPRYSDVDVVYFAEQETHWPDDWNVVGYNYKTKVAYVTIFSAPDAERRAKEYADYKNRNGDNSVQSGTKISERHYGTAAGTTERKLSAGEDSSECGA